MKKSAPAKKPQTKKPTAKRPAKPTTPAPKAKAPPKPPPRKVPPKPAPKPVAKGSSPTPARAKAPVKPAGKGSRMKAQGAAPATAAKPAAPPAEASPVAHASEEAPHVEAPTSAPRSAPTNDAPHPAPTASAADATAAKPKKKRKADPGVAAQPASPAPPTPVYAEDDDRRDATEIPGEAIDGARLSKAIRYAAKVCPKKADLVFTADDQGQPLVSGHDLRRSHTGFLPLHAAFHVSAAVPRSEAIELADALDGLSGPRVRIAADGLVLIRHGVGQPAMRFRIGTRAIVFHWAPPSQSGREPARGSLRIQASHQRDACQWSAAVVHTFQSRDGVEWNTLTDADSGELLARSVIAEDGRDLYAEDDRQQEFPGSRTAGGGHLGMGGPARPRDTAVERALRDVGDAAAQASSASPAAPAETSGGTATADAEPQVLVDGKPIAEVEAATVATESPEPTPADPPEGGRVWIAQLTWDDLSPDGQRALTDLVEPDSLTTEAAPGWVRADVAAVACRALAKVASDCDLTLHWGAEPPRTNADVAPAASAPADLQVWVRESDWDALSTEAYDEIAALLGEEAFDGQEGWISAQVPGEKAAAFRTLALKRKVPFEEGDAPPGSTRAPDEGGGSELPGDDADEAVNA